MTDPFEARVGTSIAGGKWTLERLIGVGGMAAVYAARHRLGHEAAIKILHPSVARSGEIRQRFEREAYAMGRLEHPGSVSVQDIDSTEDGAPYIVMELLEGESLKELVVRRNGLPPDELVPIAVKALDVVAAAHDEGIVHRDLKPDNLFVTGEGEVKVLDFGIARMREGAAPMTQVGTRLGTLPYMPPEQVLGQAVDHRVDIFAMGAVMFRILTKKRIHAAKTESEMIVKMSTQPAPPIQSVKAAVPDDVAAVVDRALAFRADDRYPTARAMQADLQAIQQGKAPLAAPGVASVTGAAPPFVPVPPSSPTRTGDPTGPLSAPTRAGDFTGPASAPTRVGAAPPGVAGAGEGRPSRTSPTAPGAPPSRGGGVYDPRAMAAVAATEGTMVSTSPTPPSVEPTQISGRATGPTGTLIPAEQGVAVAATSLPGSALGPASTNATDDKETSEKRLLLAAAIAAAVVVLGGLAFALGGDDAGTTDEVSGSTSKRGRSDDDDGGGDVGDVGEVPSSYLDWGKPGDDEDGATGGIDPQDRVDGPPISSPPAAKPVAHGKTEEEKRAEEEERRKAEEKQRKEEEKRRKEEKKRQKKAEKKKKKSKKRGRGHDDD